MKSPFPILTLEILDLLSSLKSYLSWVMWFVQPLSIIQSFVDSLVMTHDVVRSSFSSNLSSTILTSSSKSWDLHTFSICHNWPHLWHLTSGLHQHQLGWWPFFLQWRQDGKTNWVDDIFSCNRDKMKKLVCCCICFFCCSWLREYSLHCTFNCLMIFFSHQSLLFWMEENMSHGAILEIWRYKI